MDCTNGGHRRAATRGVDRAEISSSGPGLGRRTRWIVDTMALTGAPARLGPLGRAAKRALDIAVSLALLALALPIFLVVAVAIKVESPGSVFFRARRAGYRSAPVAVLKFRKMRDGAVGPALTSQHDQRLTRVGAFLAGTHLDELPQLWNVLRGEMSLVGPRPEDIQFTALHPGAYEEILSVRPGITGCTQLVWVRERELLSSADDRVRHYVDDMLPRKVALDRAYAASQSLAIDAKVLLWTPLVLLLGFAVVVDPDRQILRLVRHTRGVRPASRATTTGRRRVGEAVG